MNMKLKKFVLVNTIIIFLINFPLHFLYDTFPNFFTSLIAPVNESVFEHMKMVFSSFVIYSLFYSLVFKRKDIIKYLFSFSISAIVCIAIFLIIYVPFVIIYKEVMIVTFVILFFSILLSQIVCYYILFHTKIKYQNIITFSILLFFYIMFYILTYYPPKYEFFKDPITNDYGLES